MTVDFLPIAPDPEALARSPPKKKPARVALDASGQVTEYAPRDSLECLPPKQVPVYYDIASPHLRGDSTSLQLQHKKLKRCEWCSNEIPQTATESYCSLCIDWYIILWLILSKLVQLF